jgi:deazaflavin-dependent oxidoreductase (nitroreductase family)
MSKQAVLDRVRVLNKLVTNKILIHIAGKKFGHFAILSHTGRKTGKLYKTPIIAEPVEDGFVIALTYGKKVDWLANIISRGSCDLYWKKQHYCRALPEFITREDGLKAFPSPLNRILKKVEIEHFLRLSIK